MRIILLRLLKQPPMFIPPMDHPPMHRNRIPQDRLEQARALRGAYRVDPPLRQRKIDRFRKIQRSRGVEPEIYPSATCIVSLE